VSESGAVSSVSDIEHPTPPRFSLQLLLIRPRRGGAAWDGSLRAIMVHCRDSFQIEPSRSAASPQPAFTYVGPRLAHGLRRCLVPSSSGPLWPAVATMGKVQGMADPTLAEVKLVLDLRESNRASKTTGWARFVAALAMFSGTPTSDNWARLAGAATELQAAIAAERSRKPTLGRIQADQMMAPRSPGPADPPGRGRDVLMARAVNGIIIAGGPVRTNVPGQWRFSLSETPSAGWRDRLLELAIADPVAAALDVKVEGASLLFISGETMREALEALRALYRLLLNATLPAR
jgi:hypothetical protein